MIFEVIKSALIEQLGLEENSIKPHAYIERDLELDSTETVIIALEIKKQFRVEYKFPDEDVTLQDIVDKVEMLCSELVS